MSNVNRSFVSGRLGKDPDVRYTPAGNAVCNMSIACNSSHKDKHGAYVDHTEWINIECWGKTAENCGKYLNKGSNVFIEGRLVYNKYEDKDGNKKVSARIKADKITFLDAPKKADPTNNTENVVDIIQQTFTNEDMPF